LVFRASAAEMGAVENSALGSIVEGVSEVTGAEGVAGVLRVDTHSEGRLLYRSILQFRQTIRPVKEFRRVVSAERRAAPMRSIVANQEYVSQY